MDKCWSSGETTCNTDSTSELESQDDSLSGCPNPCATWPDTDDEGSVLHPSVSLDGLDEEVAAARFTLCLMEVVEAADRKTAASTTQQPAANQSPLISTRGGRRHSKTSAVGRAGGPDAAASAPAASPAAAPPAAQAAAVAAGPRDVGSIAIRQPIPAGLVARTGPDAQAAPAASPAAPPSGAGGLQATIADGAGAARPKPCPAAAEPPAPARRALPVLLGSRQQLPIGAPPAWQKTGDPLGRPPAAAEPHAATRALPVLLGSLGPGGRSASGNVKQSTSTCSPDTVEGDGPANEEQGAGPTTLMIRNLPRGLTTQCLVEELNTTGMAGRFDFCYLPCDFRGHENKGFAFVNLKDAATARGLAKAWHRSRRFGIQTMEPALNLSIAEVQGKDANVKQWESAHRRRVRNPHLRPFIADTEV